MKRKILKVGFSPYTVLLSPGLKEVRNYCWETIADKVLDFYNEGINYKDKNL